MGKDKKKSPKYPTVSICTPTFNRRPFIPIIIKCFENQTYPKDKIEWLIVDDGTDKIEDLVKHIPQVKYFKYDEKMSLGKKRNLLNEKSTGDIIVFMDDDDYYPAERVSHAVTTLTNSKALCAGSSAMFIHFKHINKMYLFGPYGPNHATAATFAFKRELLKVTRFNETSCIAEEKQFLKDYTIPFVQLESKKSILVFSHEQNSFDKKELLAQGPNPSMHYSTLVPADFVKEPDILRFFTDDINNLTSYEPGKPENKPDVIKQIAEMKQKREVMIQEHMKKQAEQEEMMNKLQIASSLPAAQNKINEMSVLIQQLTLENNQLTEKVTYLEDKMKQIISDRIKERRIALSQEAPTITSLS